jgi:hypothetical protein
MFGTERPPTAPTLVRQVLVTAALVALSHYLPLTVAPTKRGAFVDGELSTDFVGSRVVAVRVVPLVVRRDDGHVVEPETRA